MSDTLKKQVISVRVGPCRCGCKGKDPHHRASYVRTVTNVHELVGAPREPVRVWDSAKSELVSGEYAFTYTHEGVAKLPSGVVKVRQLATVHLTSGKVTPITWKVVYENPVFSA